MEILFNVVGGFVVEVGKFVSKCIYPKIENTVRFSSNIENQRKEMEELKKFRDDINGKVEGAETEGYKPKPNVLKWLEDVHELENEWESMQESIAAAKTLAYKCCPKCSLRSEISTQARNIQDQVCRLKEVGENFGSNLVVENYQMKKVEFIPGPSTEGQSAATKNLNKILQLLEDDKVCIIGVWGMGGVGKTTLVKNLNNELLKTAASCSKLSFGIVVWVTVPKPPIDIRKVQTQIVNRLNLKIDNEESVESTASKIYQRLKQEKSFLLILDDVWEAINLDLIGVPQPEDPARSKVILTSRFLDVCRQMKSDTEMKVYILDEDESWQLFVKNAGDSANLEHIQPFATEIARECNGLPLAISVIGASMRGKKRVELWKDALVSLKMSEPHNKDVTDKVYKVVKWSFDSLESSNIELPFEQIRKHVNKRRGDIQSCFLHCSLYPAAISIDDLINCWWAEGILGEHDTYEEAYNRGITVIESLKDACLLAAHEMDYVKMHDVVRDVARWITNSSGNEHNSLIQAGVGLTDISHIKMSASVKRISFISNKIERVPDCFMECPETTTLLLQDNCLENIPHEFFLAFPAIRVLNLSETAIGALPSSINSLYQLHALILQSCEWLKVLPPIGNLRNLQVLDCANTMLHCLPQGMDKLADLRLLNLPTNYLKESIGRGFFLKFSSIEIINMLGSCLGPTSFDEISSLHSLTSLSINLDSSSIFNRDHTWMTRLKRFHIEIGRTIFIESARAICISKCEIFSNGELSGMLQFASYLCLVQCRGLRKLIAYNSFDGLKSLHIGHCSCDFRQMEEGSGQFDPLPNLEYLSLAALVELFVQCDSSQTTLVNSELPRVRKLLVKDLPKLGTFGEPQSLWDHLEELTLIRCNQIRKLPLSIQTSNNIKIIGESEWWSQLEWDDDVKSNLDRCFKESCWWKNQS